MRDLLGPFFVSLAMCLIVSCAMVSDFFASFILCVFVSLLCFAFLRFVDGLGTSAFLLVVRCVC